MARKLPVGIQDFQKLRRDGYAYVDKTAYVKKLAELSTPFFSVVPAALARAC